MIWPSQKREHQRKLREERLAEAKAAWSKGKEAQDKLSQSITNPSMLVPPTYGPTGATGATGPSGFTGVTVPYWTPMSAYSTAMQAVFPSVSAPTPLVIKDLGLSIEPIVGLRSYNLDMDLMELESFNHAPWAYRQAHIAYCNSNPFADHDAPFESCVCGIYAWKAEKVEMAVGPIYGEVYLWGDVLVCEYGYRAEMAYPKNLFVKAPQTRTAERIRAKLEDAYGVPVKIVDPVLPTEETFDITGFGGTNPFLSS